MSCEDLMEWATVGFMWVAILTMLTGIVVVWTEVIL